MNRAAAIMAGVAALAGAGSLTLLARPARTAQGVYIRRIGATMLAAAALILGMFAWGLLRVAG
jgi:hypothetical protein